MFGPRSGKTMTMTGPVTDSPTADPAAGPTAADATPEAPARSGHRRTDLFTGVGYLAGAGYVMIALLLHPGATIVAAGAGEQTASEWWLRHGVRALTGAEPLLHGTPPGGRGTVPVLHAHGFPGLSLPLAPATWLLGPAHTFALAVTLCLAGTAYAWYLLLSRCLVHTRTAAVLGGALAGFAPPMIAHAHGDLPRVAQFLVPLLVWQVCRLREPGHLMRDGLLLGVVAAWQALIDLEYALVLGLVAAVFLVAYLLFAARGPVRGEITVAARKLGIATLVAALVLGYPLWRQGPMPHAGRTGVDLFSFVAFSPSSVATWPVGALHYAGAVTEQQTYYGWPLVLALVVGGWWLLRGPARRALAVTAVVVALLSLGDRVTLKGRPTPVPGPWHWLGGLPGLHWIHPVDLALGLLPVVVLLAAQLVDRGTTAVGADGERSSRLAWWALLAAVLLPIAPVPVGVTHFVGPGWRHVAAAIAVAAVATPGKPT